MVEMKSCGKYNTCRGGKGGTCRYLGFHWKGDNYGSEDASTISVVFQGLRGRRGLETRHLCPLPGDSFIVSNVIYCDWMGKGEVSAGVFISNL